MAGVTRRQRTAEVRFCLLRPVASPALPPSLWSGRGYCYPLRDATITPFLLVPPPSLFQATSRRTPRTRSSPPARAELAVPCSCQPTSSIKPKELGASWADSSALAHRGSPSPGHYTPTLSKASPLPPSLPPYDLILTDPFCPAPPWDTHRPGHHWWCSPHQQAGSRAGVGAAWAAGKHGWLAHPLSLSHRLWTLR